MPCRALHLLSHIIKESIVGWHVHKIRVQPWLMDTLLIVNRACPFWQWHNNRATKAACFFVLVHEIIKVRLLHTVHALNKHWHTHSTQAADSNNGRGNFEFRSDLLSTYSRNSQISVVTNWPFCGRWWWLSGWNNGSWRRRRAAEPSSFATLMTKRGNVFYCTS